jgi:hypothetical protein
LNDPSTVPAEFFTVTIMISPGPTFFGESTIDGSAAKECFAETSPIRMTRLIWIILFRIPHSAFRT